MESLSVLHIRLKGRIRRAKRRVSLSLYPNWGRLLKRLIALNIKLRQLATRDALTGLLNLRGLESSFVREVSAIERGIHPHTAKVTDIEQNPIRITALVLDLDGFKAVNDTLGHEAGDKVLIAVADILNECVPRASDLRARMGGDEFFVAMFGANVEDAKGKAELILQRMWNNKVLLAHQVNGAPVSVSIGIAPVNIDEKTHNPEKDLRLGKKCADAAMYMAKKAGKGCIAIFDPETIQVS